MKETPGVRQFRALYAFVFVLVIFLAIAAFIPLMQFRGEVKTIATDDAERDLVMLGSHLHESMIRHDYTAIRESITRWGSGNDRVLSIRAVAPNGFVFSEYHREETSRLAHPLSISKEIRQNGRLLATLHLTEDFTAFEHEAEKLVTRNVFAFAVFAVALGAMLWLTLRHAAILPMQKLVAEVQNLNLTLEERVRSRTADLARANEDLEHEIGERIKAERHVRQAKESLEGQNEELRKIDQMKDALIRDVSHELKTPVAKHAMQLEMLQPLLREGRLTESERQALSVMDESVHRQMSVIRNLLNLSRLEAGGRQYRLEEVHLDKLVRKVLKDYRESIDLHRIAVSVDMPEIILESDVEMLWHVFSNLLSNAIKFRRTENSPEITISARLDTGSAVVRIEDNGIGMAREVQESIFTRFFQASPSSEGSGVGLTICKRIVEDLGGSLSLESPGIDRGSVATVRLPTA